MINEWKWLFSRGTDEDFERQDEQFTASHGKMHPKAELVGVVE